LRRSFVVLALLAALPAPTGCRRVGDDDKKLDPEAAKANLAARLADAAPAAPRAPSTHKPLLWEVANGHGGKSYLLGTMHLGFDYEDLPALVWDRFAESSRLVLELDLRNPDRAVAEKYAMLPPGQSLRAMLGERTWLLLKEAAGDIQEEYLDRMSAWSAMQMVLARLYPTVLPLDLAMLREAEKQKKELVFLETLEFQLAMAAEVTDTKSVAELVDDSSEARGLLSRLVTAYNAGDVAEVERAALDPANYSDRPELMERVIFARNRDWIPKLLPMLDQGGTFVAVGAAHLIGPHGLLKAFEAKGYKVTRLAP
jgi:uncharacterized protein